jgi:hypothetical protein
MQFQKSKPHEAWESVDPDLLVPVGRSAVTGTTVPVLLLLPILYTPFGLWRFFQTP